MYPRWKIENREDSSILVRLEIKINHLICLSWFRRINGTVDVILSYFPFFKVACPIHNSNCFDKEWMLSFGGFLYKWLAVFDDIFHIIDQLKI